MGHLPVQLTERVLGRETQVVPRVHHVAVLVQEGFEASNVIRVYLVKLVG